MHKPDLVIESRLNQARANRSLFDSQRVLAILTIVLSSLFLVLPLSAEGSESEAARDQLWQKHWGRPLTEEALIFLQPSDFQPLKDSHTRWEMRLFENGEPVGEGDFVEYDDTRIPVLSESAMLPDGRVLSAELAAVAGDFAGAGAAPTVVTAGLISLKVDGQPIGRILQLARDQPSKISALRSIAEIENGIRLMREQGIELTGRAPFKGIGGEGVGGDFPAFEPGACDAPGIGDHCRAGYCACSSAAIQQFLNDTGSCVFSFLRVMLSCGCVNTTGPIGFLCVFSCFNASAGFLSSCPGAIEGLEQGIGQLDACRVDAIDCYCDDFPALNPDFCADWMMGDVPLRAQFTGLVPGERLDVTSQCILPQPPNSVLSEHQITVDRTGAFIEVHRCSQGQLYNIATSRVDTPHVGASSERSCSPVHRVGTTPSDSVDVTFDCSCTPPWNANNCPRAQLRATVDGLLAGESFGLGAILTPAVPGAWPDVILTGEALTNTQTMAMGIGFPGGRVGQFFRVSGPERCQIIPRTTAIDGSSTNVVIAEVDCTCPSTEAGKAGNDPNCGSGEFSVGGIGYFFDPTQLTQSASADLRLTAGSETQDISIGLQRSNPTSFTFPNALEDGQSYRVDLLDFTADNCSLTGSVDGLIQGRNIGDLRVGCHSTFDVCDIAPMVCEIRPPTPVSCLVITGTLTVPDEVVVSVDSLGNIDIGVRFRSIPVVVLECEGGELGSKTQTIDYHGPIVQLRTVFLEPISGQIPIQGVARSDRDGVGSIDFFLDGEPISLNAFSRDEFDEWTCGEVPGQGGSCNPHSGFSGWLDTSGLSPGLHVLAVRATANNAYDVPNVDMLSFEVAEDGGSDPCDEDSTSPSLTVSPANNVVLQPGLVPITATTSDANGIDQVRFWVDGQVRETLTAPPYAYQWNADPGGHSLRVRSWDGCGNVRTRNHSVTVEDTCSADSTPPTVSITAPSNGATLTEGEVQVNASAADANGVDRVLFYVDGALQVTDTTAPFSFSWGAQPGSFQLTARAYDHCGNQRLSTAVHVTVEEEPADCDTDSSPPAIQVTHPTDGAELEPGAMTITADASDPSGVEKVMFFIDDALLSTDFTAPYSAAWNPQPGGHTVKARGHDLCGNFQAHEIAVTVGDPSGCESDHTDPFIDLTFPLDGAVLDAGSVVTITAEASDASGIDRVQFFVDDALVHADFSAPYSYTWNPSPGEHTLKVRAIDHCGHLKAEEISVTVGDATGCENDHTDPFIDLTFPQDGATLDPGVMTVTADAADTNGIDRVQFFVDGALVHADFLAPYTFLWNAPPGIHTLKARATDQCGNLKAEEISVTVGDAAGCSADNVQPSISLTFPGQGAVLQAGQPITVTASASDASGIEKVQFFFDGVLVGADLWEPYEFPWNPPPGDHQVKARAVDNCGNLRARTHDVTAQ